MTISAKVQQHFRSVASGYDAAGRRWPWSMIRRREMAAFRRLTGPLSGHEVLDLGCGAGHYTRQALADGASHVVAVDIVLAMLKQLPAIGVSAVCADAAHFATERRFDRIFIAGVLEFVASPTAVMANARTLAAADACMTILAPDTGLFARLYRRYHQGYGYRVNLFGHQGLIDLAKTTGWVVEAAASVPPFAVVQRWRIHRIT